MPGNLRTSKYTIIHTPAANHIIATHMRSTYDAYMVAERRGFVSELYCLCMGASLCVCGRWLCVSGHALSVACILNDVICLRIAFPIMRGAFIDLTEPTPLHPKATARTHIPRWPMFVGVCFAVRSSPERPPTHGTHTMRLPESRVSSLTACPTPNNG